MRSFALLLFTSCALLGQGRGGSVQPGLGGSNGMPAPAPTPVTDLCTLEGQVVDASTGQPLRKANLSLNLVGGNVGGITANHNYSATSDPAGKYSVSGLEPGRYRINVNHIGYLNTEYNSQRPGGPGTQLELARGQKMTGVVFRMTPHGVIAGHVLDEDGDPLQNVNIQLMRMNYMQGRKQLQQFGGGNSNDLGEYRVSGIIPGKYYLCAVYRGRPITMMVNGSLVMNAPGAGTAPQQEDYATTFYPGVTDPAAATPLDMKPGQQLEGLNLKLAKIPTYSVKGMVFNTTSAPPAPVPQGGRGGPNGVNVNVQLDARGSMMNMGMNQGTGVRPDGTFEFSSVAPGSYNLVALTNAGALRHVAILPVDVSHSNVEGLSITVTPGVTVSGHIRVDGDTTENIPTFSVRLNTIGPAVFGSPQPAKADEQDNFRIDEVNPDRFDVNVMPLTGTLYVKSIRAGNVDVLNTGLDLTGGGGANLDVVIGVNAPTITGTVQNPATQQPAVATTVVLIPQEPERHNVSVYYRIANTDQNGSFTMPRVNPGEYKLYAWEDMETNSWYDPDVMKPMESKGTPVSVKEGNPSTVQLTVIPAASGN